MRSCPRIEQRDADRFEVCDITRDNRQTVNHRRRSDKGIAFRSPVRDMKARATLRYHCIDSKDSIREARQDLLVDPGAQDCTFRGVLACDFERAQLDLKNGDG